MTTVSVIEQWTVLAGNEEDDIARSVDLDLSGNSYVAGQTEGSITGFPNQGSYDAVISKIDASGSINWASLSGDPTTEFAYSVNTRGNYVILTGMTGSNLGGTGGATSQDIFIVKYDLDGTKEWQVQNAAAGEQIAYDSTVDTGGNIYITGSTNSDLDGQTQIGGDD